jgi:molybdopterin-binding protein
VVSILQYSKVHDALIAEPALADAPCTVCAHMPEDLSLGEAAAALGVSVDTLRRWDRNGRITTTRDGRNRRLVPASEVERLSTRPTRHRTGTERSARNRFAGVVRSVECDGVMALVELEAGPFLVTAAITRDSVEELGLAAGVTATAVVKATSVMIERGATD